MLVLPRVVFLPSPSPWLPTPMSDQEIPFDTYAVVSNDEGQYSIWPTTLEMPPGWSRVGDPGSKEECLRYIEEHWTDMRPLSLQRRMGAVGVQAAGTDGG